MVELKDIVTLASHLCQAYMEIDRAHARRLKQKQQREQQERKRQERQKGAIDAEFRVVEE